MFIELSGRLTPGINKVKNIDSEVIARNDTNILTYLEMKIHRF
jgi:hypothetical protein